MNSMNSMNNIKQFYPFNQYISDMNKIADMVKDIKNPHIVSIYRGSLSMGAFLSNKLDIPLSIIKYQSYNGNDKTLQILHTENIKPDDTIVIVDDLGDSYETLRKAYSVFAGYKVQSFTLFGKAELNNVVHSNTYINEHEGNWIVFEHNGEVM